MVHQYLNIATPIIILCIDSLLIQSPSKYAINFDTQ